MKLKYYLRGLGIGIFITTLILSIAYKNRKPISDDEVKQRAMALGMVETDENSFLSITQEEKTTTEKVTEESTTEKVTEESTTEKVTEKTTTEKPTEKVTESTTESQTKPPEDEAVKYTLQISKGMYSEIVADELYEAGIISNTGDFNAVLENGGYSERIGTGKFELSSDMSYEEIAKIICRIK